MQSIPSHERETGAGVRSSKTHARATGPIPLLLAALLGGCASYEPLPVDPQEILRSLEAIRLEPTPSGEPEAATTRTVPSSSPEFEPGQLAAFAVSNHPELKAIRAEIGVSAALLVEAGLLEDPEIGWDAMDAIAAQIVEDSVGRLEVLAGLGLSIPLPRPGELDARRGAARMRVEEVRRTVITAEWKLALAVHLACEDVQTAETLLTLNEELTRVVAGTHDYFERARDAGVATSIESNLARGDLLAIRLERLRLEAQVREARQELNALLGLPPTVPVALASASAVTVLEDMPTDPAALVQLAVDRRPDLAAVLAEYGAAEESLRLEVARQFPQISIGTGLWIVPGFLTRFNRPAIATAIARREAVARRIEVAVHEIRGEVVDAQTDLQESRRQIDFLLNEVVPNAEESLALAEEAFTAGEATLLEILNVQRALVSALTRHADARAEVARRTWRLSAITGMILGSDASPDRTVPEVEE